MCTSAMEYSRALIEEIMIESWLKHMSCVQSDARINGSAHTYFQEMFLLEKRNKILGPIQVIAWDKDPVL